MLIVYLPLILELSAARYESASAAPAGAYLGRWLLITAAAFLLSALAYAIRIRAHRRRRPRAEGG